MGKELNRTAYCGEFRACDAGKTVQVYGWVQRRRPLGGLIFITLRDRTGILQLTFDENENKELFDQAYALRPEDVITAVGTVRMRSEETRNAKMDTGSISKRLNN